VEEAMQMDGLRRMLDYLKMMRGAGIHFRIERQQPEALMVTFSRKDVCIEVEFFVGELEHSIFTTAESGFMTGDILSTLLREHWGD
jgi:hypothetical protein